MKSLLLFVIFASSCFAPLAAKAQTGVITGRVVAEDGGGLANVNVSLYPAYAGQRNPVSHLSTTTDEDGNFKFTGVSPRAYSIYVQEARGYVNRFIPFSERSYYRIGDHAVITVIRGGVITGRVTTAEGEPMIGAQVSVTMTRDAEGNSLRRRYFSRSRMTDDRGIYRLYGLPTGTYVVAVRSNLSIQQISPYDGETPIYHPSSNRDTTAEVEVVSGGEAAGIDIRYRIERGHTVSGIVTGAGETSQPYVNLYSVATGSYVGTGRVRPGERANSFAFHGVSDGEYEMVAQVFVSNDADNFVSAPRRVTVRGADFVGIELKLSPRASITGKIVVENQPSDCKPKREFSIEEAVVTLRRDENTSEPRTVYRSYVNDMAPDDKGEFTIRRIDPGRYFIQPRLPAENWYVKSISSATSAPAAGDAGRPVAVPDLARTGVTLKSGEKLAGVTVTIAGGAASLSGKVVTAKEGTRLPSRLRIHLAPAEQTSANDALRYAETIVLPDGAFAFNNIAPGKYWVIARAAPDNESSDKPFTPIAWDANERAKLRKEAEAMKIEVELKPCQRVTEQIVKFSK
jgi:hypothetical protein